MKYKSPPHRIRKNSFLLLEVLIALTLVAFCLFPLLKPLAKLRGIEKEKLQTLHATHNAKLEFAKVKEALFENKIAWNALKKEHDSYTIEIVEDFNKTSKNERYYLLEITFKESNATFPLLIKKKNEEEKT